MNTTMIYYVYVLLSDKDNKYYIGVSADLRRRISEHKNGFVKSTRNRRPFRLILKEGFGYKTEALRRERFLKSVAGRKYIAKVKQNVL